MTPDISAIAKKHANTYAGRDEADPLGLEEHGLAQRIRFAILEATASLRAQLKTTEDLSTELIRIHKITEGERDVALAQVETLRAALMKFAPQVAQGSPLNGKHDENCECATCVSLDAAGVE